MAHFAKPAEGGLDRALPAPGRSALAPSLAPSADLSSNYLVSGRHLVTRCQTSSGSRRSAKNRFDLQKHDKR